MVEDLSHLENSLPPSPPSPTAVELSLPLLHPPPGPARPCCFTGLISSQTRSLLEGRVVWKCGSSFEGTFHSATSWPRKGSYLCPSKGLKYIGSFEGGQFHGEGTLIIVNVEVYNGSFAKGLKHGRGTLNWKGGSVEGAWEAGVKSGMCTVKDGEGRKVYEGAFRNDAREQGASYEYGEGGDVVVFYNGGWEGERYSGYGVLEDAAGKYEVRVIHRYHCFQLRCHF